MADEDFTDDYFSQENKKKRERLVCNVFLQKLNLRFDEKDVVASDDEPPDVVFRYDRKIEGRFEIKELLDPGRCRHDEYRGIARGAACYELKDYVPQDITPEQIGGRILELLQGLKNRYSPDARRNLDLLVYVNLMKYFLKDGPMLSASEFEPYGWRSVSALKGCSAALVMFAASHAPMFLRHYVGVTRRR